MQILTRSERDIYLSGIDYKIGKRSGRIVDPSALGTFYRNIYATYYSTQHLSERNPWAAALRRSYRAFKNAGWRFIRFAQAAWNIISTRSEYRRKNPHNERR
jgi:hypothetical protein